MESVVLNEARVVANYVRVRYSAQDLHLLEGGRLVGGEGLALGKNVQTDCSVNAVIDGKTYCFGNETAKTLFMKDVAGNLAKAEAYYSSKKQ